MSDQISNQMMEGILSWYDDNARELPWRAKPSNPYHVLLSEFMLQQTTVATVKDYFFRFISRWPTIEDLADETDEEIMREWAGLGYYARARNLLKTVREIKRLGYFPNTAKELLTLAGVGPYTSAAIASIGFDEAILPRDGNINRILARVRGIYDPINRPSLQLAEAALNWAHPIRSGDLAQALMDLGATVCRPINPKCDHCPLRRGCFANLKGETDELPVKIKLKAKKQQTAHAFIILTKDGRIGFERRAEMKLLGNQWALPTSEWVKDATFEPPIAGNWEPHGEIKHVFTHIDLRLQLWLLRLDDAPQSNEITFMGPSDISISHLPRLWGKALEKLGLFAH